ncbi:hypothetical protein F5Y19DRAFT_477707 [Xylariaceae sp. FL1651]|nr:hypothetical protein F5Y19DRAFT_477707 [Xylariaceae sp. FL1651]
MDNVYLGIWTNWSRGAILGPTLTLSKRDGNLLIAFIAFFIAFVATRFWKIFCLFLHRYYSSTDPQDTICHQRQVVLRNSANPESGLTSFIKLLVAWRSRVPAKKLAVLAFPTIIAVVILAGFTTAGGFSATISTSVGDEVLIRGTECGQTSILPGRTDFVRQISLDASKLNNAANYAEQCYNNTGSGTLECNKFVVKALATTTIDRNAGCPFPNDICSRKEHNIRLDTGYLDSNDHFGLNAPSGQRFQWRYVMHCAPIQTKGYSTSSDNGTWVRYHYGGSQIPSGRNTTTSIDYTYEVPSIEAQYEERSDQVIDGLNFRLLSAPLQLPFIQPIEALTPSAGDTTLIFLSGYGIEFTPAMDDDWYQATIPYGNFLIAYGNSNMSANVTTFRPVEAASPLACVEQWQWCNSALPKGTNRSDCGPLDGQVSAAYGAAYLFNLSSADLDPDRPTSNTAAGTRLIWPLLALVWNPTNIENIIAHLGAKSLASQARVNDGLQYSLPQDQWHYDVTHWFNTVLAAVQASFVDVATGPASYGFPDLYGPPLNAEEEKLCRSQKIRSSSHTSFSLFGLLFTAIAGALIVGTSYALEPILAFLYRCRSYQQYAYLEWVSNQNLQLHRLAHEDGGEKGDVETDHSVPSRHRKWSQCTKDVPVTAGDVQLAALDVTDKEHPMLRMPSITMSSETVTPADSDEDQLNLAAVESPAVGMLMAVESSDAAAPEESTERQTDTTAAENMVLSLSVTTQSASTSTIPETAESDTNERSHTRPDVLGSNGPRPESL